MDKAEKKLIDQLQKETLKHNHVAFIAKKKYKRNYITPEDITEALETVSEDMVRLNVLEVLGNTSGFGAEDSGLCAFVAHKGKEK